MTHCLRRSAEVFQIPLLNVAKNESRHNEWVMFEWVMSNMWYECGTYECGMLDDRRNESCWQWMSRVGNERVIFAMNESCWQWMSHFGNEWVLFAMKESNESCHTYMHASSHVTHTYMHSHVTHTYKWVMSHIHTCIKSHTHTHKWNKSHKYEHVMSHTWISHPTHPWMGHVTHMNAHAGNYKNCCVLLLRRLQVLHLVSVFFFVSRNKKINACALVLKTINACALVRIFFFNACAPVCSVGWEVRTIYVPCLIVSDNAGIMTHAYAATNVCCWILHIQQRPIGCLKLQVIFRIGATTYWALFRKMICIEKASYGSWPPFIRHFVLFLVVWDNACVMTQSYAATIFFAHAKITRSTMRLLHCLFFFFFWFCLFWFRVKEVSCAAVLWIAGSASSLFLGLVVAAYKWVRRQAYEWVMTPALSHTMRPKKIQKRE